jgi:hypothetical protein
LLGEQSGRGKAAKFPRAAGAPAIVAARPGPAKAGAPNAQRCALGWAAALGPASSNLARSGARRGGALGPALPACGGAGRS